MKQFPSSGNINSRTHQVKIEVGMAVGFLFWNESPVYFCDHLAQPVKLPVWFNVLLHIEYEIIRGI